MAQGLKGAFWFLLLIIVLASCGWYFATSNPTQKTEKTSKDLPDMFAYDVVVRQFNKNGELENFLTSPEVFHIAQKDTYYFNNPYFIIKNQNNDPPWEIKAIKAIALNGGKKIILNNDVNIMKKPDANNRYNSFKTETLTYFPKLKLATTKAPICYEENGQKIQSVGMKAYLDKKSIQLLSNARGYYDPTQKG